MKNLIKTYAIFVCAIIIGMVLGAPDTHAAIPFAKTGTLIRFQSEPRVFLVKDDAGAMEWIETEVEFHARKFSFKNVQTVFDSYYFLYHEVAGEDIVVTPTLPEPQTGPIIFVKEGGTILRDTNSSAPWSAASITKLVTALVLNDMDLDWAAPVTLSKQDEVGGARLRVNVGSRYRRDDLLHASLMGSANNATYALARTSGVPMKEFIRLMNVKVQSLGMHNSHFVDPTGLEVENISTAADLAILIETAGRQKLITDVAQKQRYTLDSLGAKPTHHTISNTNAFIMSGEPVVLGKTGYLEESRYNFAMVVPQEVGQDRTIIVLNAPTKAESFQLARKFASLVQ